MHLTKLAQRYKHGQAKIGNSYLDIYKKGFGSKMSSRRINEPLQSRSLFRTERMMKDGGEWYFLTREGTVKGPFSCQADAQRQLEVYIRMALHDMLPEGSQLSLAD